MRTNLNHLRFPLRSNGTGIWGALFAVLTMCLCAATASAVSNPNAIVVSQVTWLNALQGVGAEAGSGGALASANTAGTNFGVNSNGDIILSNTYGNQILLFNGQNGAVTVLGTFGPGNASGIALDSKDNLYVAGLYTNNIAKVPYINGAYVSGISSFSNTTPACTGSDTAVCLFSTHLTDAANGYYFGVVSMAFDAAGDFFFSLTNANTLPNAILECTVACLSTGTPSPALIYQEPTTTNAATIGQLNIGAMAFDPWGDLFFTDSAISSAGSGESVSSNLNELVYSKGAFASKPTVIQTLTDASPGSYDDELDAVAVDSNGTVYYATQFDGVWAYPNNGGTVDTAGLYGISSQGAKLLQVNSKGELFVVSYSALINTGGSDTLARVSVNSLSAPASPVGTPSTAAFVTVMDNNGAGCTSPPVITFAAAETGKPSTEFAAAITPPTGKATTSCATQAAGSDFPVTVTFTPTNVGERVAVLSATDGTNTGTATSSGVGQGPLVTLDPGIWTTHTSGFTDPESISIDGLGNLAIADSTGNAVFEIPAGATAPVSIGTGFSSPDATAFDTDGNLFIADSGNHQIVEIPDVAGVLVPASQSVLVSDTVTFGGAVLTTPSGLAFGPHGVLYISDLGAGAGDGRVLTYNPTNGVAGVRASGLSFPWGVAVDAAGSVYVAETGGGDVKVFQGGGVVTTLTPEGVTAPWGVAVDASGSVLISDKASGNIVRVPNVAGSLNAADAVTVEVNPKSAYGLALDASGDLYSTDGSGAAAYAVQRTASSINLGTVDDDSTAEQTIFVASAGNTALTLGSPIFSAPTNALFSLAAGSPVGCSSSYKGAVGTACELTAEFAPTNGTATMSQSATSAISSNALNAASAPISFSASDVFENLIVQTITGFAPPASVTFGAAPITLSATGGASGNPVVFSVLSGPATLSGSTLAFTGAGSVVVAANQAGNSEYEVAPQVTATIIVKKASQTIHFPVPVTGPVTFDKVKTIALHATATSHLTVHFSVASGPGKIVGDTLTITAAGTIEIAASQGGNGNYLAAKPVTQKVLVIKASQKITFTPPPSEVAYGVKPITLKATSSSKLPVKFSVISGPATLKGDVLTIDGAGLVIVAANQPGNVDFDQAPQVKESIKVTKAQLIVAASNLSMKQGAAVPTLTYAITGFVNGDKQKTATTGKPALSTTATSKSPAGKYPIDITVGTLKAADYTFKFADGTLTVQ